MCSPPDSCRACFLSLGNQLEAYIHAWGCTTWGNEFRSLETWTPPSEQAVSLVMVPTILPGRIWARGQDPGVRMLWHQNIMEQHELLPVCGHEITSSLGSRAC